MSVNIIPSGPVKIIALTGQRAVTGVDHSKVGAQTVRLGEPVDVWTLKKEPGNETFRLTIGGYAHIGVINDKVTASIHPEVETEWIATHRENHKAYTISPVYDRSKGWTVPPVLCLNPDIEINHLISTKSLPPQFSDFQLFHIVPVDH